MAVPAFMQTAPPTVPGIPVANSSPVNPCSAAKASSLARGAPASAHTHGKRPADGPVLALHVDRSHALQDDHHAPEPPVPDEQVRPSAEDKIVPLPAS